MTIKTFLNGLTTKTLQAIHSELIKDFDFAESENDKMDILNISVIILTILCGRPDMDAPVAK